VPKVKVNLAERSYTVHVERGALDRAASLLPRGLKVTRAFIVSDENVAPLYAKRAEASFAAAGLPVSVAVMPAGEGEKNLARLEWLYHEIVKAGLDRKSLVIALGGGVVGDVAGFAAATYMRGVPLMQVPTTIVAQVDSSIGGKTGVDLPEGKNLVGAFYQPVAVVTDPETLSTLPAREVRAGLAEVVKHGVILDAAYFQRLERLGEALTRMDASTAEEVILRSVEIKADVVSRDEREAGLRAILNFGHTAAHALETVTGYSKYLHGEAVAIGMVVAARIAVAMRMADGTVASRIVALLAHVGLPTDGAGASADACMDAMMRDKKTLSGKARFVLPRAIGAIEIVDSVPEGTVRRALVATGFAG